MSSPEFDLVVVGAGPAALSAALYSAREDVKTLVLDKDIAGGLVAQTAMVENYPGFPDGISGPDLAEAMQAQARRFGAEIRTGVEATGLAAGPHGVAVQTSAGNVLSRVALIATGNHYRRLDVPGEQTLYGRGVHYCATCDGALYRDRELVVVGGGNSAMQEGLYLTTFASRITMLVRGNQLKGSEVLIDKVQQHPKIEVRYGTTVERINGQDLVNSVTIKTGTQRSDLACDGVFIFIGLMPNSGWLEYSGVALDDRGFVVTNGKYQTNLAGVYAAGDIRSGATFQIASAVGEGVSAALAIRDFLEHHAA